MSTILERRQRIDVVALGQSLFSRLARTLVRASSREIAFDAFAQLLHDDLGAISVAVFEIDPLLQTSRLEFQTGVHVFDANAVVPQFWQTRCGWVAENSRPQFIEQVDPTFGLSTGKVFSASVHSVAILPLLAGGATNGVLTLCLDGSLSLTNDACEFLVDVATQASMSLRNTAEFTDMKRRAQRLTALARAQQQLTQISNEKSLPALIVEAVRSLIPAEACEVFSVTREGLMRVLAVRDGQPIQRAPALKDEREIVDLTLSTGISRLSVHLHDSTYWKRGAMEICVPVRFGSRTSGALRVVSSSSSAFDMEDMDALTILARHAGAAVETSRLFAIQEFQRQRAEGAAELARVTLQATNLADGARELLGVLDLFVPSIGKAIGAARGRDGMIEYVATSGTLDVLLGHRPGTAAAIAGLSPGGAPVELANLNEIAAPAVADALPDERGFIVPLAARDRTIGVLVTTVARGAPLSNRDQVTLHRLSSSLALALDALLHDDEERLAREREHLLATALTTIDHPIFILDRAGVRYANPAAAREYGWTQLELMEMSFEQLVTTDNRTELRTNSAFVEAGVSFAEHVHRRQDGTEFPATVTVSPLASHDGQRIGEVVSVRNVTADRRMAEQLRNTEKMVALGELVAGVAHEINNPLTGISAFAQILLEEDLSEDQLESVGLIKHECDRAEAVIRDLLVFARSSETDSGPVDINVLIRQTLRLRNYQMRHVDVNVDLDLDPVAPQVRGDSQKLQQVLMNVISNAEFAMSGLSTRTLTLRTVQDDGFVRIEAGDTGVGMAPDVRRRMFEPFFTTKQEGVGTGLGLSVSYGIIQAHGGTIDVRSQPGLGTTVSIILPVVGRTAPTADAPLAAGNPPVPASSQNTDPLT